MNPLIQNGLVVTGHGRHYVVETEDGARRICHPRGKKSQAVVGDHVRWLSPAAGQGEEGTIEEILPRSNLFYRQDEVRTKAFAANIDQILVLLGAEPVFSEWQLAKALVAAQAAGIPALIGLNKQDLAEPFAQAWQRLGAYRQLWPAGLPVAVADPANAQAAAAGSPAVPPSAAASEAEQPLYPVYRLQMDAPHGGEDWDALWAQLSGKATLVLGPSGVGKSTLINRLVPSAAAQTAEISRALNSGKHTTTTTTWYWVDGQEKTAVLDSPGFQEFGLNHIEWQQLPHWMPDIGRHATGCRFYNCTHIHEPGCVVRDAVAADDAVSPEPVAESSAGAAASLPLITASRYALYEALFAELRGGR